LDPIHIALIWRWLLEVPEGLLCDLKGVAVTALMI
jgi:hypothetical protein